MVSFVLPTLYSNPEGWGPLESGEEDGLGSDVFNFAFEHLDKYPLPRGARICDFTIAGLKYQEQRMAKGKGMKGKGKAPPPKPDDEGFALVDNRPLPNKSFGRGKGFGAGRGKGRGKGIASNYQEGILGQNKKQPIQNNFKGKGKGKGFQQRRGVPSFKEWSVATKSEWPLKREITLNEMGKLQLDASGVTVKDIMWCGDLPTYDKSFDRLTLSREKNIRRYEDLNFFNVTIAEDPMLEDMMKDHPDVQVFATDHVLAGLVSAARSVYSWDLVISKCEGKLIIDKRDGSQIDFWSVNETAQEPPSNDEKENINSAVRLSQEASCINQNFSQMMLDRNIEPDEFECPNPFEDESEGKAASGAYRYRKFTIPGNPKEKEEFGQEPLHLIVRSDVNCKMPGGDENKPQLCSLKALNEYDPKVTYSWRKHLDTQRGMVIATELKNNSFKLGRWTAQAMLSGCDMMKIGFVSRTDPKDPWNHSILAVHTYNTEGFAGQIGMHRNNVFGIIRAIANMVMEYEDGKYLLIKDPLKPFMRLFEVPWDSFQADDEEEDGEDDEEEQDVDEDGNVRPAQAVGPTLG